MFPLERTLLQPVSRVMFSWCLPWHPLHTVCNQWTDPTSQESWWGTEGLHEAHRKVLWGGRHAAFRCRCLCQCRTPILIKNFWDDSLHTPKTHKADFQKSHAISWTAGQNWRNMKAWIKCAAHPLQSHWKPLQNITRTGVNTKAIISIPRKLRISIKSPLT